MSKSIVYDKSVAFATRIMRMCHYLHDNKKEYIISNQIGRSGTSIGANISEALNSISYKEYLSKMYISLKECRETLYWLDILAKTGLITTTQYNSMHYDCCELFRMLTAIARTTRTSLNATNKSKKNQP